MDVINFIVQHFKEEWAMITGAPIILSVTGTVLAVILYYWHRSRFDHVVRSQEWIIKSKDARYDALLQQYELAKEVAELAPRVGKDSTDAPEQIVAAANTTIDALASEVLSLKNQLNVQRRRSLTEEQARIIATLGSVSEPFSVSIVYNGANAEAEEYARQFWGVGIEHYVHFGLNPTNEIPMSFEGIAIRVKDPETPPPKAQRLSSALSKAGIAHRIESRISEYAGVSIPDNYCDLAIGRKETKSTDRA